MPLRSIINNGLFTISCAATLSFAALPPAHARAPLPPSAWSSSSKAPDAKTLEKKALLGDSETMYQWGLSLKGKDDGKARAYLTVAKMMGRAPTTDVLTYLAAGKTGSGTYAVTFAGTIRTLALSQYLGRGTTKDTVRGVAFGIIASIILTRDTDLTALLNYYVEKMPQKDRTHAELLAREMLMRLAPVQEQQSNPATGRNDQRRKDVSALYEAILHYMTAHTGSPPADISVTAKEICRNGAASCTGLLDIGALVGPYITVIPADPSAPVTGNGTRYLAKLEDGVLTVTAPDAEGGAVILANSPGVTLGIRTSSSAPSPSSFPDLGVYVTGTKPRLAPGGDVTYTVTVRNQANIAAPGVMLLVGLPSINAEMQPLLDRRCVMKGNGIACSFDTLLPRTEVSTVIQLHLNKHASCDGAWAFLARTQSALTDRSPSDNTALGYAMFTCGRTPTAK